MSRLDRFFLVLSSIGIVWALIGFIPGVASDIAKGFGFAVLALLAAGGLLVRYLAKGSITVPREPVIWAVGGIVVTGLISTIVSGIFHVSFWGVLGQTGSFMSILVILGWFLLGARVGHASRSAHTLLLAILAVLPVLILLVCVQVAVPAFSAFIQRLTAGSGTLAGSWKTAWTLAGILLVAHTVLLAWRPRLWQWATTGFLFLVFFVLAPRSVWVTAGASFLLLVLLVLSVREKVSLWGKTWVRAASVFGSALVISLLAVWFGAFVQSRLVPGIANIQSQLVPSVQATLRADVYALRHHPVFGPTPVAFNWAWQESVRPDARIMSWWRSVGTGTSYILTIPMMFGVVGILAWLFFIIAAVGTLIRGLPKKVRKAADESDVEKQGMSIDRMLWGGMLAYLFLTVVRMPVSLPILMIFALSLGIFVRLCAGSTWNVFEFSYIKDPRSGLLGTLGIFAALALAVLCAGAVIRMGGSEWSLARAQVRIQQGNPSAAQDDIIRSAAWWKHPRTLIASSQVYGAMLRDRVSDPNANQAVVKADAQQLVASSLAAGRKAVEMAPRDASVRGAYADLVASLSALGIQGAGDEAIAQYDAATTVAAYDIGWTIRKAALVSQTDKVAAENLVRSTLAVTPTYDALQFLANLRIQSRDRSGALAILEQGFSILPWNPYLFRDAGLVAITLGNGTKARDSFDRAIALGLRDQVTVAGAIRSRQMMGQTEEANALIERVKTVFPNIVQTVNQLSAQGQLPEVPADDGAGDTEEAVTAKP